EGRPCVLGGVRIPHPSGPVGHSDGDAVLHAVADALLGAAGLEDLGTLFPDTEPRYRGESSSVLLHAVMERVRAQGFRVVNLDVVVATEGPRIAPYRAAIREKIAQLCGIESAEVNVKGKSLEGLAPGGDARCVAAQAVCLLERD